MSPRNFAIRSPSSHQTLPLVVHIPHDSMRVPEPWRSQIQLDDPALARELLTMTDAYTEELFAPSSVSRGGVAFVNQLSRLVFDPERFESDEQEPMSRKGMGAVYIRTSDGRPLRRADFSAAQRGEIIHRLFRPYALALEDLVSRILDTQGRCLIIDGHSFPAKPLPYEDATLERPDLCLGYDPYHASEVLFRALEQVGRRAGWSVGRNVPFAGSYVPLSRFRSDPRVRSIMIEINRGRYMDETTGAKGHGFDEARQMIDYLIAEALLIEAYRSTRFEAMTPRGRITLRVDERNPESDALLGDFSSRSWAFITAWNPSSCVTSAEENRARNRNLEERLRTMGFPIFEGHGWPSDPEWEAEESFLALGVPENVAIDLGREFGQNAVVCGEIGGPAILVDCRE
jgi:N-formylglutamate deformylase